MIPLATGGLFAAGLPGYHNEWKFVSPACLVFMALVNASKYTERYSIGGIIEILLWPDQYVLH
jgi:hypothetical protein